ncbi:MAG TPA: hypothetical protein VLT90_15745 [Terriglobales bacterium]|nr:hypothetical protein [Terriglobales bacterium]
MLRPSVTHPTLSGAELKLRRQREGLLLSRTHLLEQLRNTIHPARRQLLQQAIAELDRQLAAGE